MKHLSMLTALAFAAPGAEARTVTLTFDEFASATSTCQPDSYSTADVTVTRPMCHNSPIVYLADGPATITALPGVTFDLTALRIEWSFPEVLGVALAALPAGVDPFTPDGYDAIWQAGLWSLQPFPNFQISGYLGGQLVTEATYYLPDSGSVANSGAPYYLPDANAPFSTLFSGLDQLVFTNAPGLDTAQDFGIARIGDMFYTCPDTCGFVVFDDVVLDVASAPPPPAPVPLPAAGGLLLAALGGLALWRKSARPQP